MTDHRRAQLMQSTDMAPVAGTVDLAIPVGELWEFFLQSRHWPSWNSCFYWVCNPRLQLGDKLVWAFQPIRPWYLYKLPASATIVELEPRRKVTWEVTMLPGFYALHTYHMEEISPGRTRFGSWEQAMGIGFRLGRWFWLPHFKFVRDRSLEGARALERRYREQGTLVVSAGAVLS